MLPRRQIVALTLSAAAAVLTAVVLGGDQDGGAHARSADAAAPNRTMSGRVSTCVRPRRARLQALTSDGRVLPFRIAAGDRPRCRNGTLRILRIEPIEIAGEATFVRRGGCDRPTRAARCRRQPTAHVQARDLAAVPVQPARRNGNGAPAGSCTREAVTTPGTVRRELGRMFYKRPSDLPGRSVAGALWSNYGNPGRRFGRAGTSYVLWNLPRTPRGVLPGGGIVRAVLAAGQRLLLCDVAGLSLPSFDARGRRNGRVRFEYAQVPVGETTVHGWMMRGYASRGRPLTETLAVSTP